MPIYGPEQGIPSADTAAAYSSGVQFKASVSRVNLNPQYVCLTPGLTFCAVISSKSDKPSIILVADLILAST